MIDPRQRETLWKEYYKALHRGDKSAAQRIINQLHNPPTSGAMRSSYGRSSGGCSKCKKSF